MSESHNMKPRVSVGMPIRNGGDLLAVAMRSIIDQTERDIEIIFSDNGSEDGTAEYVLKLAQIDSRIRYFRQDPPLRAYDNFHFVLSQARGNYFMWAAHDDFRDLDFITKLADQLDRDTDAVLAFGDIFVVKTYNNSSKKQPFAFSTTGLGSWGRMKKVSRLQCYYFYGLWRGSAVRRVPYAYCSWWPDLPMMMSASLLGHFAYVADVRFYSNEIIKTSAERVKYQDYSNSFSLIYSVLNLLRATYLSCSQVGGSVAGFFAVYLVFIRQVDSFPGFLARRIRRIFAL